ncbi:Metal cation symporter ZIP14 [Taenia crassiceps]|uniref:Metal cation symporter ZIP14 n=1 Tax=Taenia crassiceps TaxID=6207 RepID=A0ABR4Q3X5_9CEST
MASPFTFLMVLSTPSTLFRHWTLVLFLATFLYSSFQGPLPITAEPTLVLHSVSNRFAGDCLHNDTVAITPLLDQAYDENPLVTIPLTTLPNIEESAVLLKIRSRNDSSFESFVLQITSGKEEKHRSLVEVIIFAFLGVTITNLCAVTGFICIPIKRSKYFNLLMTFMMALAVSALFSTAILVLIPEAMRMADMPLEFGGQGHSYLIKLSCVPAGLLIFFCIEYVLLVSSRLLKLNKSSVSESDASLESMVKPKNLAILEGGDSIAIQPVAHSTQPSLSCMNFSVKGLVEIAPMAWMVLLGDSIHNFMDGMAIAVGFTESPLVGTAICLCILFEELPHELGDFAVLIVSGFSVKSAIFANFASACIAYLGLILGLIIGEVSSGALYVFMATSGVFLYISLSSMFPSIRETLKEAEKKSGSSLGLFMTQMFGLVTGYACVLGVIHASSYIAF